MVFYSINCVFITRNLGNIKVIFLNKRYFNFIKIKNKNKGFFKNYIYILKLKKINI